MRAMSRPSPRRKRKTEAGLDSSAAPGAGMRLSELIERYLAASGGYGKPAALSALGLTRAETESAFSQFDEDYMISRFFHFSKQSGEAFRINGFPQTHIEIDAEIQAIL
jgi:hypothetical protein